MKHSRSEPLQHGQHSSSSKNIAVFAQFSALLLVHKYGRTAGCQRTQSAGTNKLLVGACNPMSAKRPSPCRLARKHAPCRWRTWAPTVSQNKVVLMNEKSAGRSSSSSLLRGAAPNKNRTPGTNHTNTNSILPGSPTRRPDWLMVGVFTYISIVSFCLNV